MSNLSKRQRQILDFITDFIKKHNYSPSFREIGEYFKLSSPATIHAHIHTLKNRGVIEFSPNIPRSIELKNIENIWSKAIELPLVGLITAGEPIEAIEENEMISIPSSLVRQKKESFVLKVNGRSMIEEGILDGDFVIIEKNTAPRNGDIVVALLNNNYATLKKFFRESDRIRLQPANSSMKPIYYKNPVIQGIVRGVIRKF